MNKNIFLVLIYFFTISHTYAQQELWGTRYNEYDNNSGNLFKTDLNGENGQTMFDFNPAISKIPSGKLFQASNGKLYGVTSQGGNSNAGTLYEYDLILNKFRVLHHFEYMGDYGYPKDGVIETLPGILYGTRGYRYSFRYNINTETTSAGPQLPEIIIQNGGVFTFFAGEMTQASNGSVYSITSGGFSCTPNGYLTSKIIKINPANNSYTTPYIFPCFDIGSNSEGSMIEALPNKLFGSCREGWGVSTSGMLFNFDITNNTLTKLFDFDENVSGKLPRKLVNGNNGKLYGITETGGTNPYFPEEHYGTLFQYDIASNTFNTLYNFGYNPVLNINVRYPYSLMKTSDYELIGLCSGGIFKYNIENNTFTIPLSNLPLIPFSGNIVTDLIEICRKPSYHFFDTDTFDACVGGTFTYDVQNTNATTYQWIKGNVELPTQTTGILNLNNLTTADAGEYTCRMTNECGTTTTMPLHLTVNCLGTNTIANLDQAIKFYPNPASDWLNIELPQNIAVIITGCTLTNLIGQTVNQSISNNKIEVGHLQQGVYFVSLQTNYGNWNGKFVKK